MSQLPPSVQRVACYLRRSREDLEAENRGEDTLLAQRELILKDILPRYNVDFELYEEVKSGENIKDRPQFQRLLDGIRQNKYQGIVVKDLYRLGRGNYSDMGVVYDLIRDKRIVIITRDNVLDPANHDDLRNIRFSMFLSREEYEATVWRLVNGKYDKARNRGAWVAGSTPFGYDYHRQSRKLIPNQDAKTVKLIFELFAHQDLGYAAISTRLKQLNLKTPKGLDYWHPMQIRRILNNPVYVGTVRYRITKRQKSDGKIVYRPEEEHIVYENAHEPIIDRETWEATQRKLQKSLPKHNLDFSPCELAGLVTCGTCGRKMIRQASTQRYRHRNSNDISVYKKSFLACLPCGHYVKYDDVLQQVIGYLTSITKLDTDVLQMVLQQYSQSKTSRVDLDRTLEDAINRKRLLEMRLERAREFLLDGTFSKEEYEELRTKIDSQIHDLDESINLIRSQIEGSSSVAPDVQYIADRLQTMLDIYQSLEDKTKKNALLRAIFDSIELIFLGKRGRSNAFELNLVLDFGFLEQPN